MDSVQMWAIMHGEYSFYLKYQLDSNLTKLGRILCFDYCLRYEHRKLYVIWARSTGSKITEFDLNLSLTPFLRSSLGFKSLKKNQSEFQMAPVVQFCLI